MFTVLGAIGCEATTGGPLNLLGLVYHGRKSSNPRPSTPPFKELPGTCAISAARQCKAPSGQHTVADRWFRHKYSGGASMFGPLSSTRPAEG
jgi:hypothetical protein